MMAKVKPKDMFLNFKDVSVDYDAADSSVLVTAEMETGLSIRGALIWTVHLVECIPAAPGGGAGVKVRQTICLSTRAGLAAMPAIGDDGVICKYAFDDMGAAQCWQAPKPLQFLPPVPIAAPGIHVYAQTSLDVAAMRGDTVEMRLGFTTAPLEQATYTEIAEVWGW